MDREDIEELGEVAIAILQLLSALLIVGIIIEGLLNTVG